jgi:hypothetical protein
VNKKEIISEIKDIQEEVEQIELMKWETIKGLFQAYKILLGYKIVEWLMPKGYQWAYFTEPTTTELFWKDMKGKKHSEMKFFPLKYKEIIMPEFPDNGGIVLFTRDSNPIHIIAQLEFDNAMLRSKLAEHGIC